MKRTLSVLLASLMLSGVSLAAGRSPPASMPVAKPAAEQPDAAMGAMTAPAVPMLLPQAPPAMSPQMMLEGLSALKGSRDGTTKDVATPRRVKRMLMGKGRGKIGDNKDGLNKGKLKQIGNTGEFPYTTIGLVASGCSGTVVMKRFVLTSAWCVFDLKAKKFFENLNFFPAANGKKTPFGEVQWKNAWVTKGFAEKGDLNFAYGLIELDQDIGDKTGWFGFGDLPRGNKQFTLTGYPLAEVPPATMWETKCPVDKAEENSIFYRCPGNGKSLAAMLGSPLWFKGKADDAWQIVGIHVTSQDDSMKAWWASRLNPAATETLLAWAKAADQPDEGTDEPDEGTDEDMTHEDTGTDEDMADKDTGEDEDMTGEDTGTDEVADQTECTCDEQGKAK